MLIPSSAVNLSSTPTLDMVLGCYYLTTLREGAKGEGKMFGDFEDAKLAYDLGTLI